MTPAIPTTPENKAKIDALYKSAADTLGYLYNRWQDEREYEDFADYENEMRKLLPAGFVFWRGTKRPFGFRFMLDGNAYALEMTGRKYGWKRLA